MLRVVAGPPPALDRAVNGLGSRRPGLLVRAAVPGAGSPTAIAAALLEPLGKPLPDAGHHPRDLERLPLWLRAHEVRDVAITHADLYDADALTAVAGAVAPAGASLWLLVDPGLERAVLDALAPGERETTPWDAFASRWLDAPDAPAEGGSAALDVGHLWRAEYGRLRRRATDALGTTPYLEGFCAGAAVVNGRRPSREATAERLRDLLEPLTDRACRVEAARGADVGLRPSGWELRLDLQRVAGGPASFVGAAAPTVRVAAVRRERDPMRSAALALAASGLRVEEILQVRLGDVSPDGSSVRLRRDSVAIEETVRPALRVQALRMADAGAEALDHLFAASPPFTVSGMTRTILATVQAIGDSFFAAGMRDRPGEHERWLNGQGFWLVYRPVSEREPLRPEGVDPESFRAIVAEALRQRMARGAEACGCGQGHVPPTSPLPAYPPERHHAPPPADHPWRRRRAQPGAAA